MTITMLSSRLCGDRLSKNVTPQNDITVQADCAFNDDVAYQTTVFKFQIMFHTVNYSPETKLNYEASIFGCLATEDLGNYNWLAKTA